MKPNSNPNRLSPNVIKVKTSSLPNILDSEGEEVDGQEPNPSAKSPASAAGSERNYKAKKWRIPKFLKKPAVDRNENVENSSEIKTNEDRTRYQHVPDIVESGCPIDIEINPPAEPYAHDRKEPEETTHDMIDVKSYISQSRSDVGQYEYSPTEFSQFVRGGSYRSQGARLPNETSLDRSGSNRSHGSRVCNSDAGSTGRSRSATMAARIDADRLEIPGLGSENHTGDCASVNSRKDSGIRSNSRRSSIQQQVIGS